MLDGIKKREHTIQKLMVLLSSDKHVPSVLFSPCSWREGIESGQKAKLLRITESIN